MKPQANEQKKELQLLIADCLHSWTLIEIELSHTFTSLVQAKDLTVSYIVWDSVKSFEAKLKTVDALMDYTLKDEELKKIWERLLDRITKAKGQRAQIAHFGFFGNSKSISVVPYLSMAMIHTNIKELKRLNKNDLDFRNKSFLEIRSAIQWFAICAGSEGPDTKDVVRAPNLIIEIRKLISQTPAKPQHRDQSSAE